MNVSHDAHNPVPEAAPAAPDRAALEAWMTRQIAETLEVSPAEIDARAPFTSLGLESLDAFTLAGDLADWLGRDLSATLLWEHPSIEALAAFLCEGTPSAWQSLTALQPLGTRPPFFCVHGMGGSVLCYRDLARHLGTEQPFYAFQARLPDADATRQSLEEMAAGFVRELRAFQAHGPYLLGGLSFGGIVAFEMARQLQRDGDEVGLVALFDSLCPGHALPLSLRRRLSLHAAWVMGLRARHERLSYVRARIRAKMGAVRASGARQLCKVTAHAARKAGRELPQAFQRLHILHNLAIRNYTARSYSGTVTLFRAQDRLGADDDPHNGWQRVAAGGVETHAVPGNHFTLLDEPNVRVLAAGLAACLKRVQECAS